jgi:hypothetical protein
MTTLRIACAMGMMLLSAVSMQLSSQANSNYTAIRNANIQIRSSLNNTPLAWATDTLEIKVNKQTGEFEARILVDNLHFATSNADFKGDKSENIGKYLTLSGILPVDDVLANTNNAIDRKVELEANFNDIDVLSTFTFTILRMPGGFSVMANGSISHRDLEIESLSELEDDLLIILSFTGY